MYTLTIVVVVAVVVVVVVVVVVTTGKKIVQINVLFAKKNTMLVVDKKSKGQR